MRPQVKRAGETPFVPQDEPALRKCRGAVNSMRSLSHFFLRGSQRGEQLRRPEASGTNCQAESNG